MTTLFYSYAIGVGFNLPLSSLVNVQVLFGRAVWSPNRQNPPDLSPVRTETLSGRAVGEGRVNHAWPFVVLPTSKLTLLENTFHTNGTVISAPVTIYTRLHNRGTYARYNAWSQLPQPGEDYEVTLNGYIRNLRWRFTNLIAL